MEFKNLHNQKKPLLVANVWNSSSAKIAEELNFQAINTSSAAISTLSECQNGEEMTLSELKYIVERMINNSKLPLSVDLESVYSWNPKGITSNIKKLERLGVVGINIEDSIVEKSRQLINTEKFANTLFEIVESLKKENINIFVNVRIDNFLLEIPDAVEETKKANPTLGECGSKRDYPSLY